MTTKKVLLAGSNDINAPVYCSKMKYSLGWQNHANIIPNKLGTQFQQLLRVEY